jgi:hypothetical protein
MSVIEGKLAVAWIHAATSFPIIRTCPEGRQPHKCVLSGMLSTSETMLAEACSHVCPAITGCLVGTIEDGGACVIVTLGAQPSGGETGARWLIWRDGSRLLARSCGTQRPPAEHASMWDALQIVAALSDAELLSAALLAEAMLRFQSEVDFR